MYSNILVPLDGSPIAEHALSQAESLAKAFGGTIHLIQVVSLYSNLGTILGGGGVAADNPQLGIDLAQQMLAYQKEKGQVYLDSIVARLSDAGITARAILDEGTADEQIMEYAEANQIDAIVMTKQGLSGLKNFFLGSVTDRVIRSCKVPVVLVPINEDSVS